MLITDTAGFIRGYVVIAADGYFLERFLNICMRRGIFLRNIRRVGSERIVACVGIGDFKRIRSIARKTATHVTILGRRGLPFLLHRMRHRRAAVFGAVFFCAVLWYCSTHIMGVAIVGNSRISEKTVVSELRELGIYRGASIGQIDRRAVQNSMMNELDDLAWIGVNIKGSKAYVEIRERLDVQRETETLPCNLVAARDGIVRMLDVKDGQTVVRVGDMVEAGDLLVSGAVDSTAEGIRYTRAFGGVYAETRYVKVREYPLEYMEKIYTGKKKSRYTLGVFGGELPLFAGSRAPFEKADSSEHETVFNCGSFVMWRDIFREYTEERRARSAEEAENIGRAELGAELECEIPEGAVIKEKNFTKSEGVGGKVKITAEIVCIEDIALQRAIDKIENMNYYIDMKETQ